MKNIILIISDTFRYDNLFDRAAMPVRTPQLDRFAERAVSVERMYTGSFPTIPQRTDMTSGRLGWPWFPWQHRTLSSQNHMPSILGQAGYVSQLICDCPHLFGAGMEHGFDGAHVLRGQEGDTFFLRMNRKIKSTGPAEKTRSDRHFRNRNLPDLSRWINQLWYREEDTFPPRTAGQAVEWLEENYRFNPFFLWLDFFDPHEPWDAPEYMVKRYDPHYKGTPMIHPNYGKASDLTAAELKNLRAHYCAEAELVDRWIGRVLQKIDDLQLWDNSVVVFTTDHGMSLGEHNRTGKSNINDRDGRNWPLYPEVAHIPFMVAAPGLPAGKTIKSIMQPVDILPTLLDLAGVKVNPPEPFHGSSFAPLLRGRSRKQPRDFAISGSYVRLENGKSLRRAVTPVLYTKSWAYAPIGATGRRELYRLSEDPYCETNVAAAHPGMVKKLDRLFMDWLEDVGAPDDAVAPFARPHRRG